MFFSEADAIAIVIMLLGFICMVRLIHLIILYKYGFRTTLEYNGDGWATEAYDTGVLADGTVTGSKGTAYKVKAKYRVKSGLYRHASVDAGTFGKGNLNKIDIILYLRNDERYIRMDNKLQWVFTIIGTIIFWLLTVLMVVSYIY